MCGGGCTGSVEVWLEAKNVLRREVTPERKKGIRRHENMMCVRLWAAGGSSGQLWRPGMDMSEACGLYRQEMQVKVQMRKRGRYDKGVGRGVEAPPTNPSSVLLSAFLPSLPPNRRSRPRRYRKRQHRKEEKRKRKTHVDR